MEIFAGVIGIVSFFAVKERDYTIQPKSQMESWASLFLLSNFSVFIYYFIFVYYFIWGFDFDQQQTTLFGKILSFPLSFYRFSIGVVVLLDACGK